MAISFCVTALTTTVARADVSHVIVVRGPDNTLWKMTCIGNNCGLDFQKIGGLFNSQPTVSWDEMEQVYVLTGVGLDNALWRSTIDANGNFNDDWTRLGGILASPPGASGGGRINTFSSKFGEDKTTKTLLAGVNYAALQNVSVTPPFPSGF